MSSNPTSEPRATAPPQGDYVVIARRYRPQTFEELIGQEHIAKALAGAIASGRVGHAYLFTGARGVGKTSAARILAKALNCEQGPSAAPCNACDICHSISAGDDVDVLEIDGASNRGIDEIRQLRQNVNVRPSRCRFKVYIIDEVHMLTREAFNALLKTLEEPPEHVKFIFCTTEPGKIPITILSRCQRFDFAGISGKAIARRLAQVCEAEQVEAEPEALQVLARRAAGSMRDSQSLLEQLLAFGSDRITADDVHAMLGTAGDQRLEQMVECLAKHEPAEALAEMDKAIGEGVDPGQLIEQLLGFCRDAMVRAAGGDPDLLLFTSPGGMAALERLLESFGLQKILAGMQILDHTLGRMRLSTQPRVLAELAVVRLASLDEVDALPELINRLRSSSVGPISPGRPASPEQPGVRSSGPSNAPAAPSKKKVAAPPAEVSPPESSVPKNVGSEEGGTDPLATSDGRRLEGVPVASTDNSQESQASGVELTAENAIKIWSQALAEVPGLAASQAKQFQDVAILAPNHLEILLKPEYTFAKSICEKPEQLVEFERALAHVVGHRVRVTFSLADAATSPVRPKPRQQVKTLHQRLMEVAEHPMLRRAADLFGAQPTGVVDPADRKQ